MTPFHPYPYIKLDIQPTAQATIWIGLKNRDTGEDYPLEHLKRACQQYVDEYKLCVTVTTTQYVYVDGDELGAAIGLLNYPRFPSTHSQIRDHALRLATLLLELFKQYKVLVVMGTETIMLSDTRKGMK
jgi:hypothetical protein